MCGIVGFLDRMPVDEKIARLKQMTDSMVHRGPDDSGTFADDKAALGFRRLSIIDLKTGHQPLANEDDSVWIVFNGEIYNFIALRERLVGKGHQFRTKTDTETIVHAYEEWGLDFVQHLKGMFGFAIWDAKQQRLVLGVDRAGIKPVYYFEDDQSFVFASEIKALPHSGLMSLEPEYRTLPYHMAFLTAPFPLTMFKGVQKLNPGHLLVYENGKSTVRKYWDVDMNSGDSEWGASAPSRVAELISQSTKSQMISDVPLGAFLSGGIDSSAICKFMADESNDPIETYFIAFSREDLNKDILMDESPYADEMAERLGSIHHSIQATTKGLEDLLPKLVWHMDEPIGDPAAITSYLVSKHARETLTVLLSGVGGDEIFGGYPRYLATRMVNNMQWVPRFLRKTFAVTTNVLPGGKFALFRNIKKLAKSIAMSPMDAYMKMLTYFGPEEQRKLFSKDFYDEYHSEDLYQYHRQYTDQTVGRPLLDRMQHLDFKTFLPCLNLAYTDKMSMAASIEVRVPFLDEDVVQSIFTLPPNLRVKGNTRKYIFKKSMQGHVPESVIWRKKTGFGSPIHSWICGQFRDVIEHYLGESRLQQQGIFNPQFVRGLLQREYQGKDYLSNHIWQLLTFQIWYDVFVDGSGVSSKTFQ